MDKPSTSKRPCSPVENKSKRFVKKKMYKPEEAMELLFSGEFSDDENPLSEGDDDDDICGNSDTDFVPESDEENVEPSNVVADELAEQYQWVDFVSDLKNINFIGSAIPLNISDRNEPSDYFNLIATDQFYELVTGETNRYAEELFLKGVEEQSRMTRWKEVSIDEFKVFLGLLYHTGTIRLSRIEDYWKTHYLFNIPVFRQFMARNRFQILLRCLHFAPNTGENMQTDRLYKLRPLLDYFNNRMEEIYYPEKNLSIDESMVLWRGRLLFRQYIKNKRHKYGVKLYMLCEPNGMVQKILIYTGAKDTDIGGMGHTSSVVYKLLENKLDKGHAVYMDNFYTSIQLANGLLQKNTYVTGTLRKNRKGIPKDLLDSKPKKGELISKSANNISIQKWKDKREIIMISTEHKGELLDTTNKRGQQITKPKAVLEYNKFMSGVDMIDQLLSYYPCERKTLRWNQKIGIHIFQLILLNSYLLFSKFAQNKLSLYDYRLKIIEYLLSHKKDVKENPEKTEENNPLHTPQPMKVEGKKKAKQKRCKYCYMNGKRRDTIYFCSNCTGQPALCLECFPVFHKNQRQ